MAGRREYWDRQEYRDRPVRRYVVTGGRAHPSRNTIRPETLLVARPGARLPTTAGREQRELLEMCRGVLSLAEAAAHLRQPASVTLVLASDLIDSGHLSIQSVSSSGLTQTEILEKLLAGLKKL